MALFRQVYTEFWKDPIVVETFTPEDKFFFLYLLTNPKTSAIGVYQITKKEMAFDLGYSQETINALMQRFIDFHKVISYDNETRELVILNWGKYNLGRGGKPFEDLCQKEVKSVKNKKLLLPIYSKVTQKGVKEVFAKILVAEGLIEVDNESSDDSSHDRGYNKDKNKNKNKNNKKNKNILSGNPTANDSTLPFFEIVSYLNKKVGSNFKAETKTTKDLIKARYNEGFTFDDFKIVIDKKTDEWLSNIEMCKYLRPATLFGSKFESYLNQPIPKGRNAANEEYEKRNKQLEREADILGF